MNINESLTRKIFGRLTEDIGDFNEDVLYNFISDKLESCEDNIAVEAASKVDGYNAEWCSDDIYDSASRKLESVRVDYIEAIIDLLMTNYDGE